MTRDDISLLPAHHLASMIKSGELSATEALNASLLRYERHNPTLNAVVTERISKAKERAAALDTMQANGESLGPLHGVPVTVKDCIDWEGAPSTWGDPAIANHHPANNATVVDQLQAAGAVIWGKTNVPFQLGEWQTHNEIHGVCNNPWDLTRTPGGSSGGSAAAVASGMAALEIGSDIGGSIRFPAHYSGIFGHKPTFGVVSQAGHTYPGQDADIDINVVGPLARSATDLAEVMRIVSAGLAPTAKTAPGDFTVGVMLDNPVGEQDAELTAVLGQAIDALEGAGVRISSAPNPVDHRAAHTVYQLLVRAATSALDRSPEDPTHAARYDAGDRDYNAIMGKGTTLGHVEWLGLANQRQRLRNTWAEYFQSVDLLLCPVSASAATLHDTTTPFGDQMIEVNGHLVSTIEQWFWASIANCPYLPASVAPVGLTDRGLPVGIQIIAPDRHDHRSITFAAVIEEVLGGYSPPPMITR